MQHWEFKPVSVDTFAEDFGAIRQMKAIEHWVPLKFSSFLCCVSSVKLWFVDANIRIENPTPYSINLSFFKMTSSTNISCLFR